MIGGAFSAEILKLARQRGTLFWGFLAVPVFSTLTACLLEAAMPGSAATSALKAYGPLRSATAALFVAGNPIAHLFFSIGAAGIFAVEYRHASWRHIVPRSSRTALLSGKLLAFLLFGGMSLLFVAVGDLLASLVVPLLQGTGLAAADFSASAFTTFAMSFLTSLLELTALAGAVALMAVLTRSLMGAILPPFLASLGISLAEAYFSGTNQVEAFALLPTGAADAIRSALLAGQGVWTTDMAAAAAVLAAWAVIPFLLSLLIFSRQNLAVE